ncbi:MAG: hypothetical protein K2Z81_09700, partial [Cyanobacteria bacterium]|nr:hypothetical protein [Cyanobacteriota bacterium]
MTPSLKETKSGWNKLIESGAGSVHICRIIFLLLVLIAQLTVLQAPATPQANVLEKSVQLDQFRTLDKTDPRAALELINQFIEKNRTNLDLQKFRWYLANRTGEDLRVLDQQRRDYDKTHDFELARLHMWCLWQSQHVKKVVEFSRLVAHQAPNVEEAVFNRALFLYVNREYTKAREDMELLQKRKNSPKLSGWITLLAGLSGRVDEARAKFEREDKQFGQNPDWLFTKCVFYRCLSRLGSADPIFTRLKKLPVSIESRKERIVFLQVTGWSWSLLFEDLKIIAAQDSVPEFYALPNQGSRVMLLLEQKRMKEAESLKTKLSRRFHNWIGSLQRFEEHNPQSRKFLEESIKQNPEQYTAYNCLGNLTPSWRDRIALIDQAIRNWPDNVDMLYIRAVLLRGYNRDADALKDFDRIERLEPTNIGIQVERLSLLLKMGRSKKDVLAELAKRKATRNLDHTGYDTVCAKIMGQIGDRKEAIKLARQLTIQFPYVLDYSITLQDLLIQDKQYKECIVVSNQCLAEFGETPAASFRRGFAYFHTGEKEKSLADMNSVLKYGPEHSALWVRAHIYLSQNRLPDAIRDGLSGHALTPNSMEWIRFLLLYCDKENRSQIDALYREVYKEIPKDRETITFLYATYLNKVHDYERARQLLEQGLAQN